MMAAPKGNTYACGNPNSGRPTTWTKEIIEKEAGHFIEWAQMPDSVVLREFASIRGYGHRYLYDWSNETHPSYNEVFRDAFDLVKTIIGVKREKVDLAKSVQRDMGMYFNELDQYEKNSAEFRARLKQKGDSKVMTPPEIVALAQALSDARERIKELESIIEQNQPVADSGLKAQSSSQVEEPFFCSVQV
jgi:hypothetical protein